MITRTATRDDSVSSVFSFIPFIKPSGRGVSGWCRRLAFVLALLACQMMPGLLPGQFVVGNVLVEDMDGHLIDMGDVSAFVSVSTGETASPADLSSDVRRLLDTGRFSYVALDVAPGEAEDTVSPPDTVDVVFRVRRRPQLTGMVEVEGNKRFRDSRIRQWIGLQPGDFFDDGLLEARAAKVRREYAKAYYPDAEVSVRLEPVNGETLVARASVEIKEGKRSRVVGARFSGVDHLPVAELRRAVGQRALWDPRRFWRKKRYDEHELEAARIAVRDLYLDRGFLDVQVLEPEVEQVRRGLLLHFDVDEGQPYRVAEISLEGLEVIEDAEIRPRLPLGPGDKASRSSIENAAVAVRQTYESRGYVDTQVSAMIEPLPEEGKVALRYRVREGRQATVRNIVIRGNTRTKDKVIRRELLLAPGDSFDGVRAARSERRLHNLGFFSEVRHFDLPTDRPDMRDLVFEVEEKRTGQFMLGAGFSSIDNLVGFMELSQGNFDIANWPYFSGGGQKLRASVEAGSRRRTYEVGFVEPWLFDRRLSLSVDAYRRTRNFREFDELRIGGSATLATSIAPYGRLGLGYTLETVWVDDLPAGAYMPLHSPDELYYFSDEKTRYLTGRLRLNWSQDLRDRPFVPTSGYRLAAFAGVAGVGFGDSHELYEAGVNARWYLSPWFGHVLSLRGRVDVMDSFSGDLPPISERLFLGGGRTMRGFAYREVGPKAVSAADALVPGRRYRPLGGRSLALFSGEYTIPLLGIMRLAGFTDAGNLWYDAFDFDLADLAVSGGVGLRIDVPGFPIRLDYAWVLRRDDPYTDTNRWVIWIGHD